MRLKFSKTTSIYKMRNLGVYPKKLKIKITSSNCIILFFFSGIYKKKKIVRRPENGAIHKKNLFTKCSRNVPYMTTVIIYLRNLSTILDTGHLNKRRYEIILLILVTRTTCNSKKNNFGMF